MAASVSLCRTGVLCLLCLTAWTAPALAREAPAARRRRIEEKLARLDAP